MQTQADTNEDAIDTLASLNWNPPPLQQPSVQAVLEATDWDKLCQLASNLNNNTPCRFLDRTNAGLYNLVRVLEFQDTTTRWIARIPLNLGRRAGQAERELDSMKLRSEISTMQLILEKGCASILPVSRIFAYKADAENEIGVPYILMELFPANTAMDSAGGYDVHRGVIPKEHRSNFYRSVARSQVHLTGLRFPKIGAIIKHTETGEYDVGPLPHIGGPFETASAFFEAWADCVRFNKNRDEIVRIMSTSAAGRELCNEIADAVESFPARIKALMARRPPSHDNGPFPLVHTDFMHSNMLVDSDFNLVGVIDWEGAQTVPWQCVTFPGFLECMPPAFDLPGKYDVSSGQPLDEATREVWEERRQYIELTKAAEKERDDDDCMLSMSLGDKDTQALAYTIKAYEDIGKFGFYNKVIQQLENR